jgi:hypothetical protein
MSSNEVNSTKNKIPLLYYKDFYEWPQHWMGFKEDIVIGNNILQEFIPFIEFLVNKKLAKSTIKKIHVRFMCSWL